jgi:hypothetical protein
MGAHAAAVPDFSLMADFDTPPVGLFYATRDMLNGPQRKL